MNNLTNILSIQWILLCLVLTDVESTNLEDLFGSEPVIYPESVRGAFEMVGPPPESTKDLGVLSAVAVNKSDGSDLFLLHRSNRMWDQYTFNDKYQYTRKYSNPIAEGVVVRIENGNITNRYLKDIFHLPHGMTIDPKGNFWITDVALHQVFKFNPNLDPRPLMVLGKRFEPGWDESHFCQPSAVAVASNGYFFVADGYCNSRIIKFDPEGNFVTEWGQPRGDLFDNDPYQLNVPHELALNEQDDLLCVADRNNNRVVCYSAGLREGEEHQTGTYRFQINLEQPVFGVAFAYKEDLLLALQMKHRSLFSPIVSVFDSSRNHVVSMAPGDMLPGRPHWISSCPPGTDFDCFAICSYDPPKDSLRSRLWMVRLLP